MSHIQDLLIEYGKWVLFESPGRLYYPSRTTFDRMRGGGIPSPMISDEAAESVSSAMAKLARHKPMLHDVLKRYYIGRQSVSLIARERKETRHLVSQALFAGETAVECLVMGMDD